MFVYAKEAYLVKKNKIEKKGKSILKKKTVLNNSIPHSLYQMFTMKLSMSRVLPI